MLGCENPKLVCSYYSTEGVLSEMHSILSRVEYVLRIEVAIVQAASYGNAYHMPWHSFHAACLLYVVQFRLVIESVHVIPSARTVLPNR
jgi:hypothetical protein